VALAAVTITVVAIWASTRAARIVGRKDPQFVCIDEVAGVLVTWVAAPPGWWSIALGFALFRWFDWWKPFPARLCERLPGGFGIVLDDVAAGIWAACILAVLGRAGWL